MASELTLSIAGKFTKGTVDVSTRDMGLDAMSITITGTDFVRGSQVIGTTAEAIGKGEITTPGYMIVVNRDATNYVEIERVTFTTGSGTVKMKAGEAACFRHGGTAPFACANTGSCIIDYWLIED